VLGRVRLEPRLDALVVVVDRDGERLLGLLLADHVGVEELEDLAGLGQLVEADLSALAELLLDDLVAQVDALVADVDARAGDQLLDLLLALPAERALQQIASVTDTCHGRSSSGSAGLVPVVSSAARASPSTVHLRALVDRTPRAIFAWRLALRG